MAQRRMMANRMAIAMAVVSEQNMAHSTPLHSTTGVAQFCGVSINACIHRQGSRATARHDAWALRTEIGGGC